FDARGDHTRAEATLERALAIAPSDEDASLALMRHHAARGREERVRQVYWDCRKALKAQLGSVPSAEFEAAYRLLLAGSGARAGILGQI
ncbi:MAG TPA: bacterial transcriptional activator domain-containing protein, partial [Oscillatoriaceae cyanobacterium]